MWGFKDFQSGWFSFALALVVAVVGWGVRVEIKLAQAKSNADLSKDIMDLRHDMNDNMKGLVTFIRNVQGDVASVSVRVRNEEELLEPVLIKYKLDELVKKPTNVHAAPGTLKKTAEDWAKSQTMRGVEEAERAKADMTSDPHSLFSEEKK